MKTMNVIMVALVAMVGIVSGNPVEDGLAAQGMVAQVNMVGDTYMVYSETTDSGYYLGGLVGFMAHAGKDVEIHVTNVTEQQTYVVKMTAQQGKALVANVGNEEGMQRMINDITASMVVVPANAPSLAGGKFDPNHITSGGPGIGMVAQ